MDEEELAIRAAIKVEVEINEEPGEVNLESEEQEEIWNKRGPEHPCGISIERSLGNESEEGATAATHKLLLCSQSRERSDQSADKPRPGLSANDKKHHAHVEGEKPTPPVVEQTQEKAFKCPECGKAFARKDNFDRHVRSHSGVKRFECAVCKFKYSDKGALLYHLRAQSGEKPFQCAVCGKCFTSKGDLSRHSLVHSGIRPYKCTICQKAFSQSGQLTGHMRSHTGEKPYECPVCNKNFSLRTILSQHMRLHSGLRPYECEICQKTFSQRGHLTRHKALHMREAVEPMSQNAMLKDSVPYVEPN